MVPGKPIYIQIARYSNLSWTPLACEIRVGLPDGFLVNSKAESSANIRGQIRAERGPSGLMPRPSIWRMPCRYVYLK